MTPHAVYLLDEKGEATGLINWACSREHADQIAASEERSAVAPDNNYVDDTVCEVCGVRLSTEVA